MALQYVAYRITLHAHWQGTGATAGGWRRADRHSLVCVRPQVTANATSLLLPDIVDGRLLMPLFHVSASRRTSGWQASLSPPDGVEAMRRHSQFVPRASCPPSIPFRIWASSHGGHRSLLTRRSDASQTSCNQGTVCCACIDSNTSTIHSHASSCGGLVRMGR